jgi:hypothetical protein
MTSNSAQVVWCIKEIESFVTDLYAPKLIVTSLRSDRTNWLKQLMSRGDLLSRTSASIFTVYSFFNNKFFRIYRLNKTSTYEERNSKTCAGVPMHGERNRESPTRAGHRA